MRIGDYEGAALSMSRLVASQSHSVRGAQRLLALDKLSAWAASPGWPAGVGGAMAEVAQEADAKLALLQLQVCVLARCVAWEGNCSCSCLCMHTELVAVASVFRLTGDWLLGGRG